MTTNFPLSLDDFTNPSSGSSLSSPSHADQHADANDAIEALEAKVGVDNSAVTTSLDYRTTALAAASSFGFVSGRYHISGTGYHSSAGTNITMSTANRCFYIPILIGVQTTFDRIAARTASTFSGSGVWRLGIYNNANGAPSSLVLDAGTVSPTAASTVYPITINQTLSIGWYWLAVCAQTVASTNSIFGYGGPIFCPVSRVSDAGFAHSLMWMQNSISGTLPDTATPIEATGSSFPLVGIRAA